MAVRAQRVDPLAPILDEVARAIGRYGVKRGSAAGAKAALRVTREEHVKRIVQAYWTPFQADIPGESVGLHLEVAEPTVHWAEAYLSPTHRNWVLVFAERPDGEVELVRYSDHATPGAGLDDFFTLAGWHVMTATDHKWTDLVYEIGPDLSWNEDREAYSDPGVSTAVQESLKKSTIMWLRWGGRENSQTMPIWYVYDAKVNKIYTVSGERQQTIPGVERIRRVEVVLRWKGKNAQVAELPADVRIIDPAEPEWTDIAEKLAEKRLNIPGLPEDTARRWRDECHVLELTLQS